MRIFQGIKEAPYFDFTDRKGYYSKALPWAAPDLEVIDVDGDGNLDLYIVQADERRKAGKNYCGGPFKPQEWWPKNKTSPMSPPNNYVPPRDKAADLLLLGNPSATKRFQRFSTVKMEHKEPGCGYFVKKFGEKSLVLVQGGFVRPGHQLLLEW